MFRKTYIVNISTYKSSKIKKKALILRVINNPLIYIFLLVIAVGVFTIYRSVTQIQTTGGEETNQENIPDIVIHNPKVNIFNDKGLHSYTIMAKTFEQYLKTNKSVFYQPTIVLFDNNGKSIWKISSDNIDVFSSESLKASGDVSIYNLDGKKEMKLATNKLVYNIKDMSISLPEEAHITYGKSSITAQNTHINTKDGKLHFSKQVKMKVIND